MTEGTYAEGYAEGLSVAGDALTHALEALDGMDMNDAVTLDAVSNTFKAMARSFQEAAASAPGTR